MKRHILLSFFLLLFSSLVAQRVEPARYEVDKWSKEQDCRIELFGAEGGIIASQTEKTDKDKNSLWRFTVVDTCLCEVNDTLIPLPPKLSLSGSTSDDRFAAFLFSNERARKSDSIAFCVVCYDRKEKTYKSIVDRLPDNSLILSLEATEGAMMMAVNNKVGEGFLLFIDCATGTSRLVYPSLPVGAVLFQTAASAIERGFVLAVREYEKRQYRATSFLVYSPSGNLLHSYRYENMENANLGRMCFDFDARHRLIVIGTLERESNKKVKLEGLLDDFDKTSIGVVWLRLGATVEAKTYLFKNMPEIEMALTPNDRVRVREERIRLKKKARGEKNEIAFQFLPPRLLRFGDMSVFAAEAFVPEYHTETRMDYGFYGMYPYSYTVFDGYDFLSEILLAFDADGQLKWQTSVRFANGLSHELHGHAGEAVCHDELIVASPHKNELRYAVFASDGSLLLPLQSEYLEPLSGADHVYDEDFATIEIWYGSRFLVSGCQDVRNSTSPKPRRTSFFFQKVQYE